VNYGPLLFLGAFFALATSWFGYVLAPQIQIGRLGETNTVPEGITYPVARPGLARQGLDVYRANGCAYCHSQQVGQTGVTCDVLLTDAGTNRNLLISALHKLKPELGDAGVQSLLSSLPKPVFQGVSRDVADAAVKDLSVGGAKAELWVQPLGPDISRGWGARRSVAADFLYDYPVMLGEQRIGPDLANVGVRLPDAHWQLEHLYQPRKFVKDSAMPPYRYLFQKRRIEHTRSLDALTQVDTEPGYEIVPTPEASALAAYLLSLRADAPLFETPMSVAAAPAASTNSPATTPPTPAGGTNK
jgi:cbb3-type cytochrome oxidase cytochrome c subunit